MPPMGLEPTIPVFEPTKKVHALHRAVTVIGITSIYCRELFSILMKEINSSSVIVT
jgi:hypothetical protein